MTTHTMMTNANGIPGTNSSGESGRVDQTLRWIGDLDHPFYSDERHRYVWYEASAISFQFLFLGSYLIAGATLWVGGGNAMPWVLAMFVPTMATAVLFQSYLKRHNAEYWPGKMDLGRRRGQFAIFAAVFLLSGLVRASLDLSGNAIGEGFAGGIGAGAIAGSLAGVGVVWFKARQQANAVEDDEF